MHERNCTRCDGRGEITAYPMAAGSDRRVVCDVCGGRGKVEGDPDPERRIQELERLLAIEQRSTSIAHEAAVKTAEDRDKLADALERLGFEPRCSRKELTEAVERDIEERRKILWRVRGKLLVDRLVVYAGGDPNRKGYTYIVWSPDHDGPPVANDPDPAKAIALALLRTRGPRQPTGKEEA